MQAVLIEKQEGKEVKNQASVLYAPLDIRIEERLVPRPGPKE